MDNSVDKSVDKVVDNLVNNSVDNLMEAVEPVKKTWFMALAEHLTSLHNDQSNLVNNQLKQLIINLGEALDRGHTCYWLGEDPTQLAVVLDHPAVVDEPLATDAPAPLVRAGDYLYFYRQWQQENRLAEQLTRILSADRTVISQMDATPSPDPTANLQQQQAINLAAQQAFSLITGGPGTGKTYTLVRIVKALQQAQPDLRIALTAPTGKAAQRMQSVLDSAFKQSGVQSSHIQTAQTVHRLLGLGVNALPRYHAAAPLPYDLIVLDEGSMLDLALASQLFDAIAPGSRLIILGDADQLAAVDAGAVLADLQQTAALQPYQVQLIQSQRFNATQGIGQLASAILKQDNSQFWQAFAKPENHAVLRHFNPQQLSDQLVFDQLWQGFSAYSQALVSQQALPQLFEAFNQYRILTAMRAGRLGVERINREMATRLQQTVSHSAGLAQWYQGRPVMMTRNDYGLRLSNGDIGLCLQDESGKWQVHFPDSGQCIAVSRLPLHDLTTAFALTIHKSQGSEFNQVAVVLDVAAQELLSRELLYTAITRARQQVDLWSDHAAADYALAHKLLRHTGLSRQLQKRLTEPHKLSEEI